jgi:hypothetical protein
MRALAFAAIAVLLAGCAGVYCATDYSGVEPRPWGSGVPDPHKGMP